MRAALAVLAAGVALAGCDVPIGTLGAVAPRPLPRDVRIVSRGRRVGEECRWWVIGVPLGLPRMEHAMAAAMAPVDGVVMRDVRVFSVHPVWGPVGRHCYRVEGEVFSAAASP